MSSMIPLMRPSVVLPFLRSNVRFSPLSVPGTWLRTVTAMMRFPVSTVDPPASAPCWMPRSSMPVISSGADGASAAGSPSLPRR